MHIQFVQHQVDGPREVQRQSVNFPQSWGIGAFRECNEAAPPTQKPLAKSLSVLGEPESDNKVQITAGPQEMDVYSNPRSDLDDDIDDDDVVVEEKDQGANVQINEDEEKEDEEEDSDDYKTSSSNDEEDMFGEMIDTELTSCDSEIDSVCSIETSGQGGSLFQRASCVGTKSYSMNNAMGPRRRSGLFMALQIGEDSAAVPAARLSRALGTQSAPELRGRAQSNSILEQSMQCTDPGEFRVCRHCRSVFPYIRSSERESLRYSFCSGECHLTYVTLYHLAAKRRGTAPTNAQQHQ